MKKIYPFLIILLIVLLIWHGEEAMLYTKDALYLCFETIIPALFPFFVCSNILIYSGFCERLSILFSPIMKPLFNINENGSIAFVIGIISGYPLGAITACELYNSHYLSKSETERLLSFCNNSGPLFIISAIGIGLYSGIDKGIILYISHICSAILVGLCMKNYNKDAHIAPKYKLKTNQITFSDSVSNAVTNSVNGILNVCGCILFFSVISKLIINALPFDVPPLIYGLFEFSSGNIEIANSGYSIPIKLITSAIITGFAGLSVQLQVMSVISKKGLSIKPYLIGKLLHGAFSGGIVALYFMINRISFSYKQLNLSFCFFASAAILSAAVLILLIFTHAKRAVKN